MSSGAFTGSVVEEATLAWLESVGWQVAYGPDIASPCLRAGSDLPVAELRLNDFGPEVPPQTQLDLRERTTA